MSVIPIGRAVKQAVDTAGRRMKMVQMHSAAARMHNALASALNIEHAVDRHEQLARVNVTFDNQVSDVTRETLIRALEMEMVVVGEAAVECDRLCAELNLPNPMAAITNGAAR